MLQHSWSLFPPLKKKCQHTHFCNVYFILNLEYQHLSDPALKMQGNFQALKCCYLLKLPLAA